MRLMMWVMVLYVRRGTVMVRIRVYFMMSWFVDEMLNECMMALPMTVMRHEEVKNIIRLK